jgi:uncharacterized membrane protein
VRGQLIKRYFITGLLIWVPLVITVWVLSVIVNTLDQSLHLLPEAVHPRNLVGFPIPGVGALLTLLIILLTGLLATNFIGQKLVIWSERLLARIPVVNSVYNSVKQVSDTLFSSSGNAFRKALLVQYPRQGSWTTPNPTSGFFLMMAKSDVIELDMTVDEALKYIISMGVVAPLPHPHPRPVNNT